MGIKIGSKVKLLTSSKYYYQAPDIIGVVVGIDGMESNWCEILWSNCQSNSYKYKGPVVDIEMVGEYLKPYNMDVEKAKVVIGLYIKHRDFTKLSEQIKETYMDELTQFEIMFLYYESIFLTKTTPY